MGPIVVAGHACVDVIPRMESATNLEPGALARAGKASFSTGGAVSNTGLALHKLGLPARPDLNVRDRHGRELYAPCFRTTVAGTTGAGDCTIAGFLAGLTHGLAPAAAMDAAMGTGAFSVEQPDATGGVPTWNELHARLRGGWERVEPSL